MALYGNTDSNANKTKVEGVRGNGPGSQSETVVFVDATEANLAENKARGISGPGWWAFATYTQGAVTRTKAECLAVISNPEANSAESQADDTIAADRTVVISAQPASQEVSAGADATFAVTAAIEGASGGSISAQWFVSSNGGGSFAPISPNASTGFGGTYIYQGSGFSGQELRITATNGAMVNYQYRVVLSTAGDSGDVTSDAATLTFS
jgi:hypothetical protein